MAESAVTFLVLVNPKSGGQDGPHLLEKFRDLFKEVSSTEYSLGRVTMMTLQETLSGEVVSLTDPAEGGGVVGPRPGLIKYKNNPHLRVLGRHGRV